MQQAEGEERSESSGTHFLEVHAPSSGMGAAGSIFLILALLGLWMIFRQCRRQGGVQPQFHSSAPIIIPQSSPPPPPSPSAASFPPAYSGFSTPWSGRFGLSQSPALHDEVMELLLRTVPPIARERRYVDEEWNHRLDRTPACTVQPLLRAAWEPPTLTPQPGRHTPYSAHTSRLAPRSWSSKIR